MLRIKAHTLIFFVKKYVFSGSSVDDAIIQIFFACVFLFNADLPILGIESFLDYFSRSAIYVVRITYTKMDEKYI